MESLAAVTQSQAIGVLALRADEPEFPSHKKTQKGQSPNAKKVGNRVLLVGRLRELALYRAEFLRQAGFAVSTADDVEDAIRMMQHSSFDAVVLSYTLSQDIAEYLANMARDYCQDCPIVAITNSDSIDHRIAADAVANADEGPTGLISALHRVLEID